MSGHMARVFAVLALSLACCACQEELGPNRKETFPVTGRVLVDGQPIDMLSIECVCLTGLDKQNPTLSSYYTGADGKFQISTYVTGDGVPEGEYALTFQWGRLNLMSHSYDGDKFNGRYRDPKKSDVKFTVRKGTPNDLGDIELKTK